MRVHELAKELGVSSRELIQRLKTAGFPVKNHFNALDERAIAAMRGTPSQPAGAAPSKKVVPPPATETPPQKQTEPAPTQTTPQKPPRPPSKPDRSRRAETVVQPPAAKKSRTDTVAAPPQTPSKPSRPGAAPVGKRPAEPRELKVKGPILVKDLAQKMGIRPNRLISDLMAMNVLASINERLDVAVAQKIAAKHGFEIAKEKRSTERHVTPVRKPELIDDDEPPDQPQDLQPRPPLVTFLGHVDHGKTSILDCIRSSAVASGEHGGITQHIGASTVTVDGKKISFLDTPGHAAFTEMRARGANLTDIAVLIIAADDGIMPQTEEAIRHAQAAKVSIMVAINKIDLPGANVDRVKQQLATAGLHPEDWGGEIICCPVSAQTGDGIDNLLEMILLQAEIMELKANPKRRANGYVVESQLESGMGPTATLLVQNGTLRLGDAVVCGQHWGRIKALIDDHGVKVKSAGPSMPVKCMGLSGVPEAGAPFRVAATDKAARARAESVRIEDQTEKRTAAAPRRASLDDLYQQMGEQDKVELRLILKADVQGSLGAIAKTLHDVRSEKVDTNILLSGVGNVTANDVLLASASRAVIIGFNVGMETGVSQMAKREGVEIRMHRIIYELADQVRDAMAGMLAPEHRERVVGHAAIKQVFTLSKGGRVAGCMVTDGQINNRCKVRIKRGEEILNENLAIVSLKRFQTDVAEVQQSQECGVRLERNPEFQENDVLEFYQVDVIKQTL